MHPWNSSKEVATRPSKVHQKIIGTSNLNSTLHIEDRIHVSVIIEIDTEVNIIGWKIPNPPNSMLPGV